MNEQLQNAVATILERAISGIDSSVDFMQAELPEVIEQLLMWYAVQGVILVFIGVALIIPMLLTIKAMIRAKNQEETAKSLLFDVYGVSGIGVFSIILSGFLAFIGVIIALSNMLDPIQILIAPKIWLIEYAASIVK